MKKIFCKIGFHKYNLIGNQTNTLDSNLFRKVKVCETCLKLKTDRPKSIYIHSDGKAYSTYIARRFFNKNNLWTPSTNDLFKKTLREYKIKQLNNYGK